MQLPGGSLNPQPQGLFQLVARLLLREIVRANDILSVNVVLAQRVPMATEPVKGHTGHVAPLGS